jgi:hypothetical protein
MSHMVFCDACGARISKRFIRAKVDVGNAKGVDVHVCTYSYDLCQRCLLEAAEKAKDD